MDSAAQDKSIERAARHLSEKKAKTEIKRIEERQKVSVSGKVYIVCVCSVDGVHDYNIYIIDPSSSASQELFGDGDGYVFRPPTLRLDWDTFHAYAFCVLDSTLFVFEQTRDLMNPKGKSVFSFDLSSIDDSKVFNRRLEKRNLTRRRPMNYPKRFPAAAPTPEGKKILVFSTMINYNGVLGYHVPFSQVHHDIEDEIDFELYDPADDSWEILPGIPHNYDRDAFDVRTFTFINNSTFLINTDIGKFTLDLDDHKSGWKPASLNYVTPCGEPLVISIKDDLAFTSFGAYDMKRLNPLSTSFGIPIADDVLSAENYEERKSSRVALLVDDEDGVERMVNFCVAQTGINKGTKSPHMFVDVLSIDVNKYKEEKKKEEGEGEPQLVACNVRALKFILHDKPCTNLYIRGIFYIRNIFSMPGAT